MHHITSVGLRSTTYPSRTTSHSNRSKQENQRSTLCCAWLLLTYLLKCYISKQALRRPYLPTKRATIQSGKEKASPSS